MNGFVRGIPDMVVEDFVNFGAFRTIHEEDRKKALNEIIFQQSGITEDTGIALGRFTGAKFLLTGSFMEFMGGLTINSRIINVETGETFAASTITGPVQNALMPPEKSLLKNLSVKLLKNFNYQLDRDEIAALADRSSTKNIDAALQNYEGELLVEKLELMEIKADKSGNKLDEKSKNLMAVEAKVKFAEAVKIDPGYDKARRNLKKLGGLLPPAI